MARLAPGRADLPMILVVCAAYFICGRIGLALAIINPIASPVWPPTGVALAVFLIWGYQTWPGVFAGAFFVNLVQFSLSYHLHPLSVRAIMESLAIATGNTSEGLLATYLVARFANGRRAFEKSEDALRFAALGGLASSMLSASIGTAVLAIGGYVHGAALLRVWTTWWLGDATGALIVAPAILLWSVPSRVVWRTSRLVEAFVLVVCLLAACEVVVFGSNRSLPDMLPLLFLCFPFLLWPAIRFGQREAASSVLVLSFLAVLGSVPGRRFVPEVSLNVSFLMLQIFIASMGVTALVVAAAISERRSAAAALTNTLDMLEETVSYRTKQLSELSGRLLRLQDEERRRLAREFHDSTAQKVVAIGINVAIAQQESSRLSDAAQQALRECLELVDETSREIRTISYVLHPPLLDDAGLASALRALAEGFSKRSGISVKLEAPDSWSRASADTELALFRVAQECLGNIQRHSGSPSARISLASRDGTITLEVQDYGKGFASEALDGGAKGTLGVGIGGMRERLRQLGGTLEIRSDKSGTLVRAKLPAIASSSQERAEEPAGDANLSERAGLA
ncbi:MAG TPA: MASE1 domain-containing protein [Candidatus Dormibacteraeota bacterium]|nr:MASE1 domain-containing protein [Candidatus Dormibacteraeota bacterium]